MAPRRLASTVFRNTSSQGLSGLRLDFLDEIRKCRFPYLKIFAKNPLFGCRFRNVAYARDAPKVEFMQ